MSQLESLELRLRRLQATVYALVGLVAVGVLCGAMALPSRLAGGYEVQDDAGRTVARLGNKGGYPALTLFDDDDNPRLILSVTDEGPALFLHDADGQVRLELSQAKGTGLHVRDADGNKRVVIAAKADGEPGFFLLDKDGNVTFSHLYEDEDQ